MIKKVLIFNLPGPDHIEEDDYKFNVGEKCTRYYQSWGWSQVIASLVEGLIFLPNITVFSTTELNYGYKVLLKNARRKTQKTHLNYTYYTSVINEDLYVEECEDKAEECDLIVIMGGRDGHDGGPAAGNGPTTYFKNEKGEVVSHLHHYMLVNHREKVAFIDPGDLLSSYNNIEGKIEYAAGPECTPQYYKIYFRREKDLDKVYNYKVVTLPFSAEERYFTGGKDFEQIWANKKLDMVSLFAEKDNSRQKVKKILSENFKDNDKCIVDYLLLGHTLHDISPNISPKPGFAREHREESQAFLQACISVDGEPGGPGDRGCYYTDRMFKSLAAGCCLFLPTPAYNVDFPNGFKDGIDVVIYDKENLNDLVDKIEYYLNNKKELKRIAKKGFENLLKYHTSEVRAKEFIETCERYMG